ncbi:hypothetical protein [Stappia sp.]|uniref:hypothetical protein n=1 Tax=Stappia sp. TaxID=1870903 RepID=UPI003A996C72
MLERRIFCFWTGENPLTENRRKGLAALRHHSGCEVVLIAADEVTDFIPARDLHPAYPHLNLAHRADFLRCYAMLRHGGGYADIKPHYHSWEPAFRQLDEDPAIWAAGYREPNPGAISNMYSSSCLLGESHDRRARAYLHRKWLQLHFRSLIGCCAFVFRPGTPFAQAWWDEMNRRLDKLLPALLEHPARHPREQPGDMHDGKPSRYPVPWTYIFGDIFHVLGGRHRSRLSTRLPAPDFSDYQ